MVAVALWGSLKSATGGRDTVEVEAKNIRELLTQLGEKFPGLRQQLERGVSISINGQLYRDAWFQPIPPNAEVVLLPKLAGG